MAHEAAGCAQPWSSRTAVAPGLAHSSKQGSPVTEELQQLHTAPDPPDDSIRDDPILSISSIKIIDGACSRAITNNSRT